MKNVIAVFLWFAVSAMGNDLSGTWTGSFRAEGGDHDTPQMFLLTQDGSKVTGTGGPDSQEQYPIENGRIDGDRLKFELTTGEWRFSYDLKQNGSDGLKGDLQLKTVNHSRNAKVSLRRLSGRNDSHVL
jgi:hypothetical protein